MDVADEGQNHSSVDTVNSRDGHDGGIHLNHPIGNFGFYFFKLDVKQFNLRNRLLNLESQRGIFNANGMGCEFL